MSRIQQVQPKYQQKALNQGQVSRAQSPSFTGGVPQGDELVKAVENEIVNKFGFFGKRIRAISNFLDKHAGEVQNQVINAIFTATLAPLMIAKNPFSKADDKTKQYSALRQPISAGIAISGGFLLTNVTNDYVNKLCSEGRISSIDARIKPDAKYLKSQYVRNNGGFFRNLGKDKKAKIKEYVEKEQKEIKEFFTHLISVQGDNITFDEATKKVVIKDVGESGKELSRVIPNINNDKELKEYLSHNNIHERTLGDFLTEHFKLEPSSGKEKISNINAMDFLREAGLIGDKTKGTSGLIDEEVLKALLEKTGQEEKVTLGQLLDLVKGQEAKAEELMQKKLSNVLDAFSTTLKKGGDAKFNMAATLKTFAENIIGGKIAKLDKNLPNFRGYTGIFFNLFITMITCTALNWVYPRVVEKFFPHLVKSDKKPEIQKGGNK